MIGFLATFLASMVIYSVKDQTWLGTVFLLTISLIVYQSFFGIRYIFEENGLRIRIKWMYNKFIPYEAIRFIKPSKDFSSAPAGSMNRYEMYCGKHGSIIISPRDIEGFIEDLKQFQPALEIRK